LVHAGNTEEEQTLKQTIINYWIRSSTYRSVILWRKMEISEKYQTIELEVTWWKVRWKCTSLHKCIQIVC